MKKQFSVKVQYLFLVALVCIVSLQACSTARRINYSFPFYQSWIDTSAQEHEYSRELIIEEKTDTSLSTNDDSVCVTLFNSTCDLEDDTAIVNVEETNHYMFYDDSGVLCGPESNLAGANVLSLFLQAIMDKYEIEKLGKIKTNKTGSDKQQIAIMHNQQIGSNVLLSLCICAAVVLIITIITLYDIKRKRRNAN